MVHPIFPLTPPLSAAFFRTPHTPRVWPMRVAAPVAPGPDEASPEMAGWTIKNRDMGH
jgi:hypothetical protein